MERLLTMDQELFRWIQAKLTNPFLDQVMPWFSHNRLFVPLAVLAGAWLIWKGRVRAVVCLLMLGIVVAIGDGFICSNLKEAVARPRPPTGEEMASSDASSPQKLRNDSFPSSHAANWFSAAMVLFLSGADAKKASI